MKAKSTFEIPQMPDRGGLGILEQEEYDLAAHGLAEQRADLKELDERLAERGDGTLPCRSAVKRAIKSLDEVKQELNRLKPSPKP